jgi:hypothetical protein
MAKKLGEKKRRKTRVNFEWAVVKRQDEEPVLQRCPLMQTCLGLDLRPKLGEEVEN